MKRTWRGFVWFCLVVSSVVAARAGAVTGIVRDGTTGKPAAGVDVVLIRLQGEMQPVATTKSDAQGRYHFDSAELGQQPMLLRAVYHGVNFHQPAPPGRPTVDIDVFEPTADPKSLAFPTRMIALQPHENALLVGEEYTIQNSSQPPKAFYRADGSFVFELPQGASLAQVSAWGPSGMPVVQGTMDKGSDRYAIPYAFRPGQNGVRLSYQLPYPGNQTALRIPAPYTTDRVILLVPPTVQVVAEGFTPAGTEQGWNLYTRSSLTAGSVVNLSVSGTAAPASARGQQGSPDAEAGGQAVTVLPARLDNVKWILVGGFSLLFVLGVVFLIRKPRALQPAPAPAAKIQSEIQRGVDEIKETLFRLELRRQAGTLSEEEYALQRGRAEKALRELVKG